MRAGRSAPHTHSYANCGSADQHANDYASTYCDLYCDRGSTDEHTDTAGNSNSESDPYIGSGGRRGWVPYCCQRLERFVLVATGSVGDLDAAPSITRLEPESTWHKSGEPLAGSPDFFRHSGAEHAFEVLRALAQGALPVRTSTQDVGVAFRLGNVPLITVTRHDAVGEPLHRVLWLLA